MERYVKWRDKSFQTTHAPERWVPEAIVDLIEGGTASSQPLLLSLEDAEKVKRGELVYTTQAQAKAAAYEMMKRYVWNEWSIPGEKIQEW